MFCTSCGSQLPDGTRFCIYCGAPQDAAPVADIPVAPVQEPASAEAFTEEALMNAVAEELAPEAPVYEDIPATQTPLAAEPIYEAPAYDSPVSQEPAYEAPVYEAPVSTEIPPVAAPKKKKKTGVIIAIILVAVLLIGGGVGAFLFISNRNANAYDDAMALLEEGKLEEAKAAFEELGSYEDAEEMVEDLTAYQDALKLLDEHKYEDARKAFKALGKFHDSKTYVESGVDYHMANYLLTCADNADPAGLDVAEIAVADNAGDDEISLHLYEAAAELFMSLDGYLDSVNKASECWLGAASVLVDWQELDTAMSYIPLLNSEDAATLQEQIESAAADSTFLADLETALIIWLDDDGEYTVAEEVQKAYDHLAVYEDLYFLDTDLEDQYYAFMDALEVQLSTIDSDGYVDDWVSFYEGQAAMYYVVDYLYNSYDFLVGSEWEDTFVGYSEELAKYPGIEKSLSIQFNNVTAPWSNAGYYYAPYTNDTGHSFTLHYTLYFFMGEERKEESEELTISIPAGETVEIPLDPKTLGDNDWDGWRIDWWFTID